MLNVCLEGLVQNAKLWHGSQKSLVNRHNMAWLLLQSAAYSKNGTAQCAWLITANASLLLLCAFHCTTCEYLTVWLAYCLLQYQCIKFLLHFCCLTQYLFPHKLCQMRSPPLGVTPQQGLSDDLEGMPVSICWMYVMLKTVTSQHCVETSCLPVLKANSDSSLELETFEGGPEKYIEGVSI